ncbi:FkbM family methyltransferase [Siccirubricoccus sp. G192]|uniref:FkbM family methyltransferase n=1 Tax=Siccirubricoccus sp. G192 TaxID=2849651 RepID=UPI001C2BF452|nr:FkbM family methyltransferase [Siccirubricoccus sp. G192]MBV1798749.1 FkbM family methyltransferase [Siccirubricoccus sp. G192]
MTLSLTISPPWESPVWYEATVQLALQDLCAARDVVFDVGANIGGIATMAAQHVGPTGRVVAFEASPRNLAQLHYNLAALHAVNVNVVPVAVAGEDGQLLGFYYGGSAVADSLAQLRAGPPDAFVPSVTLDAFCARSGLVPDVVKMDIEGGEFDALAGFMMQLERPSPPPLVLEVTSRVMELHALLSSLGYSGVDLSTYGRFDPAAAAQGISNVLYVHPRNTKGVRYLHGRKVATRNIDWRLPELSSGGGIARGKGPEEIEAGASIQFGRLEPGRYILEFQGGSIGTDVEAEIAIGMPGRTLSLHIAMLSHLVRHYSSMPFHVPIAADVHLRLKRAPLETFRAALGSLSVSRVEFQ